MFVKPSKEQLIQFASWCGVGLLLVAVLLMVLAPKQARRLADNFGAWFSGELGGEVKLATAMPGGVYHELGTLLAGEVLEDEAYSMRVLETAGSVDNVRRLRSGAADFAFIQGGLAGIGKVGPAGIMAIAKVDMQYVHIIVPADSAITTFRDVVGNRIGVGPKDSGYEALGSAVFSYFDFEEAPRLVTNHAVDFQEAFRDGEIDAAFTVYSLFSDAMERLLKTGWYRLVPVPEAASIARYFRGASAVDLPDSLYGPNRSIPSFSPFPTLAVETLLVAREDTPWRAVVAVLDALYGADFLRQSKLTRLTEDDGRRVAQVPLHPAADAFYRRHDPVSSDKFEIASFFFAGLLCTVGLSHYLIGRRQKLKIARRRHVIRPYFQKLLRHGEAVGATEDPEALAALIREMMATQCAAETSWLAGRLEEEDMENINVIYNTRTENTSSKISRLLLKGLLKEQRRVATLLERESSEGVGASGPDAAAVRASGGGVGETAYRVAFEREVERDEDPNQLKMF